MASIQKCLKILSDPTRQRILCLLAREDLSVADLQEILSMGQSRISSHLAQLRQTGFVVDRRRGKHSIYHYDAEASNEPALQNLMSIAMKGARENPESARDYSALELLRTQRRDKQRAYFDALAGKFGKQYCPGRTWKGLAQAFLTLLPPIDIADLGAGEGTLAQMLCARATRVIAVDHSPKMVAYGQKMARENGLTNLEFREGDIESPPLDSESVDLALFSQALHHAQRPEKAIAAAHRILRPGGRILILDLLQHTFAEARELYADEWLGFTRGELSEWLEEAGFTSIDIRIVDKEVGPAPWETILATANKS